MNLKNLKLLAFLPVALAFSSITNATDDMQYYYNTGDQLITQLNSCTTKPNQFSTDVFNCINLVNSKILSETSKTLKANKAYYTQYEATSINKVYNSDNEINQLKNNCKEVYPSALQSHFKNQIAYCQAQINLNRYFFLNDLRLR